MIDRDGDAYVFSDGFTHFLAVSASILQHAATDEYPIVPLEARQDAGDPDGCVLDTPAQAADVTSSPGEENDSREGEQPGCSSRYKGTVSGSEEVFSQLARRLGIKVEAAEKMCRDDVKRERLPISPEEYAQAYLAES